LPDQIKAWEGSFGDTYHHRNDRLAEIERRGQLWAHALALLPRINMDILEVGAGLGANLETIRALYRTVRLNPNLYGLEPNPVANGYLGHQFQIIEGRAEAICAIDRAFDLVFTYGVLIHLDDPVPAMREMFRVSRRFICCVEYFSPTRRAIPYRTDDQTGLPVHLAADDYGSLWMDNFDLKLLGCGFCWKRSTGLDNVTWWIFERKLL
jgi:ubiquinone/menaquinone biosynthesis C-methylase UbiE